MKAKKKKKRKGRGWKRMAEGHFGHSSPTPNFMDVAINVYNVVSDEGHENARWLSSTH